jgi:hypothetical protein
MEAKIIDTTHVRSATKDEETMKLKAVKPHKASFDYNVVFKRGGTVNVGREDPEMPGWYCCENHEGAWSWIPEEDLDISGEDGAITTDHDAEELTAERGEVLEYVTEVKHWTLHRDQDREGWIPIQSLEPTQ